MLRCRPKDLKNLKSITEGKLWSAFHPNPNGNAGPKIFFAVLPLWSWATLLSSAQFDGRESSWWPLQTDSQGGQNQVLEYSSWTDGWGRVGRICVEGTHYISVTLKVHPHTILNCCNLKGEGFLSNIGWVYSSEKLGSQSSEERCKLACFNQSGGKLSCSLWGPR